MTGVHSASLACSGARSASSETVEKTYGYFASVREGCVLVELEQGEKEDKTWTSWWREGRGYLEIKGQPNKAMTHVVLTFIESGENVGGCVLEIVHNGKAIGTTNSKPVRK